MLILCCSFRENIGSMYLGGRLVDVVDFDHAITDQLKTDRLVDFRIAPGMACNYD